MKCFRPLLYAIIGILAFSCQPKKTGESTVYNPKVSAFTSGVVSNQTPLRIVFSEQVPEAVPGKKASPSILDISPSVDGDLIWEDPQTLVLQHEEKLRSGTTYSVSLDMSEIFPGDRSEFSFTFEVIRQNFRFEKVNLRPIELNNLKNNLFSGKLVFADYEETGKIEKVVTVTQNGKNFDLEWTHPSSGHEHLFTATGIARGESAGEIKVTWDGDPVDVDNSGSEIIEIPALSDFKVMEVKTQKQPEQQIIVTFSDPLMPNQDLSGLLVIEDVPQVKYSIDANVVTIYPLTRILGEVNLKVFPGIQNILGYEFKPTETYTLRFEAIKPQVELLGNGTILPNSEGLVLPFRAVSVRAVEVSVIKIFENNIASFLQINQLDGDEQLRRAGRLVVKKTILLDNDQSLDLTRWNTFSLDLSKLIQADAGAIYRVILDIKKQFAIYPCDAIADESSQSIEDEGITDNDISYWDTPTPYSYSNWDSYDEEGEYNWEERDNPCHPMYYRDRKVSRNVLASDIGLIVKRGTDKEMVVIVSDLRSTEPISGVELEILDYQNQLVGRETSGSEGIVTIPVSRKPYLLIAKKGEQRGYLRLDEGSSLSLSRFDISGQSLKKGLKGYIYGERGVWRPGDTLFLSFMFEDKLKTIPTDHPVQFELINPQGQISARLMSNITETGLYCFKTATSESAPTGIWTAKVMVGGVSFEQPIRIETVKPNRLKIEFNFGTKLIRKNDSPVSVLKARWLHGAIAKHLNAKVSVTLNASKTTFSSYPDFVFDDPSRTFSAEEVTVFEGELNETGSATVSPSIEVSSEAPGMLRASFLTRVFEESGDFSVDRFTIPYAPYESFVGIRTPKGDKRGMLLTDTTHLIDVVTVNADGQPVNCRNLKYKVYKVSWRWWWESSEDDLARYVGSEYQNVITTGTLSTSNGKGKFKFMIKYPDWGRYLIVVEDEDGGHATGKTVYVDWPGWALKPAGSDPQEAAMLSFSSDKEKYKVGENVNITFPSPGKGRALVSLETGSKVLKAWWVETQKGMTQTSFEATPEMAPNIYAHITLVQPHRHADNDLPIRLYGVIPLLVENPETQLSPEIIMGDELQPEKEAVIRVKEADGRPMSYTLAVVDEGLLDLTRFPTPDPWSSFYAREALGVKTWDLYDYVMGAYGGSIEKAFSIGGDEELNSKKGGSKTNRFKPMVRFFGPFTLEKGKTATHKFMVPRYVGSVRTMVVANHQGAYGKSEKTTPVRKPVMVLATLPRVLGPGEKVKLPVTVFAMKENIPSVNVSVKVSGPVEISSSATQKVQFSQPGDEVIVFDLLVKEQTGHAKIKIEASAGKESASDEIDIVVRNSNPPVTTFVEKPVNPGETVTLDYHLPGIPGTNQAVIELSSIPPVDFGGRLKFLLAYPHGCIEQTTSAAFPQLYIRDVMEPKEEVVQKTEKNLMSAIHRLRGFITSDGGFAYWPGHNQSDPWGTSYAGHFLLESEKKGFALPIGWKKNWIRYQKSMASSWKSDQSGYSSGYSMLNQAYRLYTLALAGSAEMSAMNRLRNEPGLTTDARWRLAAAYALSGQTDVAGRLIENIPADNPLPSTNYYDYTYGSPERNQAMIIETLLLMGQKQKALPLVLKLSKSLSGSQWMSTQTTAYSLLAISRFIMDNGTSKNLKFDWSVNGKKVGSYTIQKPLWQDSVNVKDQTAGQISITNRSEGIIYSRLSMSGIPAIGMEEESSSNLRMTVNYYTLDGDEIDIANIEQGTDFMAEVNITNPGTMGDYKNMALSQIFPSGWEIRNTRMENINSAYNEDQPDYRDIRDDRVYSYFDVAANRNKKMIVLLNATYKGVFYLPAVSCQSMYDNTISSVIKGQWVTVE